MIPLLEDASTVLIVAMTGWIAILFWSAYRASGAPRNLLLSAAFAIICLYKFTQFVFGGLLRMESLAWMESEVASEGLIVILAIVIIVVLAGVGTRRRAVGERR